jgi:hypothetical protein
MMKALATLIMRGHLQATLVTTVFAVLSLVLPPLSYISGAVVALVTLRNGAQSGFGVAAVAALVMGALAFFSMGSPLMAVIFALVVWLPSLLLAEVLRRTVSMSLALAVAGMLSLSVVIIGHWLVGDTVAWWQQVLDKVLGAALDKQALDVSGAALGSTAQLMTAIMAAAFLLSMTISLFLGRWWQSTLYNPGGFGEEFCSLRLDKTSSILTLIVLVWALIGGGLGSMAADMAIVLLALYAVPGLALVHDWIEKTKASVFILLGIYLVLLFMPHFAVLLATLGLADTWTNLRRFIKAKQ